MSNKQRKMDTGELLGVLERSSSFGDAMESCSVSVDDPALHSHLLDLLKAHDYTPSELILKVNLSKSFVYQILNGTRVPGRDILIRISLAVGLDLDETQRLLAVARRGRLYPRIRRDAAIIFCLSRKRTLDQANDLLEEIGEKTLLPENMDE